jgi:hypothetical protein
MLVKLFLCLTDRLLTKDLSLWEASEWYLWWGKTTRRPGYLKPPAISKFGLALATPITIQ